MKGLKHITTTVTTHEMESGGTPHHMAHVDESFRCVDVIRHTPLSDAVVEIFTCVRARVFKGSFYSSFSDAIQRLRHINGTSSEDDEHDLRVPTWHVAMCGKGHDTSIALDDPLLAAVAHARDGPETALAVSAMRQAREEAWSASAEVS